MFYNHQFFIDSGSPYHKQSSVVEPGRRWCPLSSLDEHKWPERQPAVLAPPATLETSAAGSRTENYHSEFDWKRWMGIERDQQNQMIVNASKNHRRYRDHNRMSGCACEKERAFNATHRYRRFFILLNASGWMERMVFSPRFLLRD